MGLSQRERRNECIAMATQKQKAAAKKILENAGNVSKTMIEVGYAPSTAKNPMELTKSKGWKELMEEYLPDTLLAEKHNELLTVPKITKIMRKGTTTEIEESTDTHAISKGLDMAYKLKGSYAAEKRDINGVIEITGVKISVQ